MRVVHLTPSTTAEVTGGLEHHVAYLTAALRERGHEVFVVNTAALAGPDPSSSAGWLPAGLRPGWNVPLETAAMLARRLGKSQHASQITSQVDDLNPDVVHQHGYLSGLRVSWRLAPRYPVVFTNHTGAYLHLDRLLPTRLVQRRLMRRFSKVIGPSRELRPRTDNSHYVPNGVDTKRFFPVSGQTRQRLKEKHDCAGRRVFLCARRWAPTKGIIYLARALSQLPRETRERCLFLFAGNETPGYARYQENVRQALSPGAGIRVLGNLGHPELAELMNIADACVIPSLMEATSLACLESMACGTPVLGTDGGGLPELIRHDVNGWLVPVRDSRALAVRIDEIVTRGEAQLDRFREAALKTVCERYTWETVALETEKIYEAARQGWIDGQSGRRRSVSD